MQIATCVGIASIDSVSTASLHHILSMCSNKISLGRDGYGIDSEGRRLPILGYFSTQRIRWTLMLNPAWFHRFRTNSLDALYGFVNVGDRRLNPVEQSYFPIPRLPNGVLSCGDVP
jgi:hypothetical protein